MRNVLLVLILLFALPAATQAQDRNVEDVRVLMEEVARASPDRFLWKRLHAAPFGRGVEVIIVDNGRRYTIDYNWWVGGVEIYERPDGTGTERVLDCYRDQNLDGYVDYGTDGMCERRPLVLYRPHDPSTDFPRREYWQERYERALATLTRRLREDQYAER